MSASPDSDDCAFLTAAYDCALFALQRRSEMS
jgi:hypothetical protein